MGGWLCLSVNGYLGAGKFETCRKQIRGSLVEVIVYGKHKQLYQLKNIFLVYTVYNTKDLNLRYTECRNEGNQNLR